MGCHGDCPGLPCRRCCTASLFCACLGTPSGRDTWWQGHLVGYKELGLLAALGAAGPLICKTTLACGFSMLAGAAGGLQSSRIAACHMQPTLQMQTKTCMLTPYRSSMWPAGSE